jgi:UDP-N-acetylmuramoylalanine-D-glutamate ligase
MSYNITSFKSTHSIFTNFEIDHLNWHTDLQEYFDAKIRLFENTTGISCINEQVFQRAKAGDLHISNHIPNVRLFGTDNTLKDRTDGENIIISNRKKYILSETRFSGLHNAMNILSCTLITNILKICSKRIREYLKNISGLAHRMERVAIKD